MTASNLDEIAQAIVADGKGILAADETPRTLTPRLAAHGIESTPETRRAYREMLFETPGMASFIGGVILQDETIRQQGPSGRPLIDLIAEVGVIPGIKVDESTRPLAGSPGEVITEGLDGLRDRLQEYRRMGARFAKWRAVFRIADDGLPTLACMHANADAHARYAALCQEQGLVPIVEPEVLRDGAHPIERCEDVTGRILQAVFNELYEQNVRLEAMLLKPNMVTAGKDAARPASVEEVAEATVRVLRRHVPPAVPAIVFLSGGQGAVLATEHLAAMHRLGPQPWTLSFSYGRALQDEAMDAWRGVDVHAGQRAFYHRAECNHAAALGRYGRDLEGASAHA